MRGREQIIRGRGMPLVTRTTIATGTPTQIDADTGEAIVAIYIKNRSATDGLKVWFQDPSTYPTRYVVVEAASVPLTFDRLELSSFWLEGDGASVDATLLTTSQRAEA